MSKKKFELFLLYNSRVSFMLCQVEHEKFFITLGPHPLPVWGLNIKPLDYPTESTGTLMWQSENNTNFPHNSDEILKFVTFSVFHPFHSFPCIKNINNWKTGLKESTWQKVILSGVSVEEQNVLPEAEGSFPKESPVMKITTPLLQNFWGLKKNHW